MEKFFLITDDFNAIIKSNIDTEIKKIERVLNGWTNFVFKVMTSDNNNYYFRFPRNDFFSDAIVSEVKYTNFVKDKISYKTPDLILKYDKCRPFTIHKLIDGKNMYEVLNTIPEDKIQILCDDICNFIKELQNIKFNGISTRTLSNFLKELADISHTDYDYDFSKHKTLIYEENNFKRVLNHGDLNPGNILLDENYKVKAILDFAFCTESSYDEDLSRIIGRLPEKYYNYMVNSFEKITNKKIDKNNLDNLIEMWKYVDNNYVNYMKKNCPDVIIPDNL